MIKKFYSFSSAIKIITIFISLFFVITGCRNEADKETVEYETPDKGTIRISVDATFQPVISEQIKVYLSDHPDAKIIAEYKSEVECFKDLQNDSTRLIIVGRGLTKEEFEVYTNNLSYSPKNFLLAWDAVSVVINARSADSVISFKCLNEWATASSKSGKQLVVDGLNATSTVRYIQDSIGKGKPLGPNVQGVNGSREVIDYVANNVNAIGFVGSSWIGNEYDPEQVAYFGRVKQALVENMNDSLSGYYKPSQETIAQDLYPFVRPVWVIIKENSPQLGTAFVTFMRSQRGQLLFQRSQLVPGELYLGIRQINIGSAPNSNK